MQKLIRLRVTVAPAWSSNGALYTNASGTAAAPNASRSARLAAAFRASPTRGSNSNAKKKTHVTTLTTACVAHSNANAPSQYAHSPHPEAS